MMEHHTHFIGGQWQRSTSDRMIKVVGANTEEVIAHVAEGTEADIDRAVAAAREAFEGGWKDSLPAERGALLERFADALAKRIEELCRTVSAQNGMPISLARKLEGDFVLGTLRYYAALAKSTPAEEVRPSPLGFNTVVRKEPVGVVGGIVPWNYPVVLSMTKIAPAIAAGCAMVLKPSPETAMDWVIVAQAAQEAGLPKGVLNWVPGGRELGAYLVSHPDVDKISFTGSTAAGRKIAEVCGRLLRPVSLELGGKSAAILLDDVDIDSSFQNMMYPLMGNNGQTCFACTRVLAPAHRYEEMVEALARNVRGLKVGNSLDPETQIGPMVSAAHRDRVEKYIEKGKQEAKVVCGGGRPAHIGERGWFVEPTVFSEVSNGAVIAQEEIFGPVLAVIKYHDEDEAVRLANDSAFGLAGSIWSSDRDRAMSLARRIVTGTIGINGYVPDVGAPFGGVKASGIGREFGPEALSSYQHYKSIYQLG